MKEELTIKEIEKNLTEKLFNNFESSVERNIFLKYKKVYYYYSKFSDLESLKRSIFMQWYLSTENYQFSDCELDREMEKSNLLKVIKIYKNNLLDGEFVMMLHYYFEISDWYFNSFNMEFDLNEIISMNKEIKINKISYDDRGIMGVYWKSVLRT